MRFRTVPVLALASFLAGCVTAEEQRAADEAKCRSYGFSKRNDAFAECLQRIELDRRAEFRARSEIDVWDRPLYVYRPIVVAPKPQP